MWACMGVGGGGGSMGGRAGAYLPRQPGRQETLRRPAQLLQQTHPPRRQQLRQAHRQAGPQALPAHRCGEYRAAGLTTPSADPPRGTASPPPLPGAPGTTRGREGRPGATLGAGQRWAESLVVASQLSTRLLPQASPLGRRRRCGRPRILTGCPLILPPLLLLRPHPKAAYQSFVEPAAPTRR